MITCLVEPWLQLQKKKSYRGTIRISDFFPFSVLPYVLHYPIKKCSFKTRRGRTEEHSLWNKLSEVLVLRFTRPPCSRLSPGSDPEYISMTSLLKRQGQCGSQVNTRVRSRSQLALIAPPDLLLPPTLCDDHSFLHQGRTRDDVPQVLWLTTAWRNFIKTPHTAAELQQCTAWGKKSFRILFMVFIINMKNIQETEMRIL